MAYVPPWRRRRMDGGAVDADEDAGDAARAEAKQGGDARERARRAAVQSGRAERRGGPQERERRPPCQCPTNHQVYPVMAGDDAHRWRDIPPNPRARPMYEAPGAAPLGSSVLGTSEQFCEALWHCKETPEAGEWGTQVVCLRDKGNGLARLCKGKTVVAIGRLVDDAGQTILYQARYSNCFRGSPVVNDHAEEFLLQDKDLLEVLLRLPPAGSGALPPPRLVVWLTVQPCHHSSDNVRRSCTAELISFKRRVLDPRGVVLDIRFGFPYRGHWNTPAELEAYGSKIQSAQLGTRLLQFEPNVLLSAFGADDWRVLLSLCDPDVSDAGVAGLKLAEGAGADLDDLDDVFTVDRWRHRRRLDGFTAAFLARMRSLGPVPL